MRVQALSTSSALALFLSLPATSAAADRWTGSDKELHYVASAALAKMVTQVSHDPVLGFWSSVAVGAAKEWADRRTGGTPSLRDLAVDVAGAYLGTQGGGWVVFSNGKTATLLVSWSF